MNQAFRKIAQDISQSLVTEMNGSQEVVTRPNSANIVELLLQRVAEEVKHQVGANGFPGNLNYQSIEARLDTIERKLQKIATRATGVHSNDPNKAPKGFPNLKYAKPKYQNVESLLNYVERDQETGGLKLVIMNFND